MNRRVSRWLFKKATAVLGEEELASLKNDLVKPVEIAAREAVADLLGELDEENEEQEE